MSEARTTSPPNGVGLGLRWDFLEEVLDGPPLDVAFFEVSPENYMRRGGYYPSALERLGARYPIVTHGLTLSLGGSSPLDVSYLDALGDELERLATPWHSDHLAFTSAGGLAFHELMPLAFSRETLARVADRVAELAARFGRPFAVENITDYAALAGSELREADFIRTLCRESPAYLLLDVNNVYVNAQNHGFDPFGFIAALPLDRVLEIHVAGHERTPSGLLLDTHGSTTPNAVLELLSFALEHTGPVPVLLERDNSVPPLAELLDELGTLRAVYARAVARSTAPEEPARASGP
jgi:hypothetical protein